ncbi:poly [ADP-ribose] polymerase, partial [Striga asiatica]
RHQTEQMSKPKLAWQAEHSPPSTRVTSCTTLLKVVQTRNRSTQRMKVHETRSHAQAPGKEEKMVTRKQKAESEAGQSPKKAKTEDEGQDGQPSKKSIEEIKAEFEKFCKATSEHLSIQQMREILEANGQDSSGSDDAVVPLCEWSSCIYKTRDPPRIDEPIKLPNTIKDSAVIDVMHGALALRQLGAAAAHCKLVPKVANFMKVLCSQEIYRYALMEMGLDFPDLPLGEEVLLEFVKKLTETNETGLKEAALWSDFSQRVFTLMPSTRPYVFRDFSDIADHGVAAFETVRDINVASRLIGDMSGATLDDPLSDRYKNLGCTINPVDKEADDYKMIAKYLEKTYEPVKVGEISYGVMIDDVFAVEVSAGPSLEEIKKLPNKVLLWCGTRTSNLLRHLKKGFLPATCFLPVPGYMFGKAIVCSDAAAEAAKYGFTAIDRPEGFMILAVASLGENITQLTSPPEDASSLEEKKMGVIGLGRKKTDESEHFNWKGDIKVPCGKLIPSEHKDSPLEYNEYAVYDPKQVSIRFLVAVKFEEKDVVYDTAE